MTTQGRGRGRGSYSSGRGRAGRFNRTRSQQKTESRKTLQDYTYYIGSAKQASDYNTVTKYLINYVRKTYTNGDDIANALDDGTPVDINDWKPTLSISAKDQVKEKQEYEAETEEYKILYKAEVDSWIRRKDTYRSNVGRAYALLYERCNKAMQSKLQSRKDFDTIKGDPFKLLEAIKEHSVSYQENKYPMTSITDAIRNIVNLRQKEDESLIDYTRRFKVARDVLKSQLGGPLILAPVAKNISGYDPKDPDKVRECEEEAYQQWLSYVYVSNTDKAKYGTLISGLSSQFALGQDQYPKTIVSATNVLSNHRFDSAYTDREKKRKANRDKQKLEHDEQVLEPEEEQREAAFAQFEGKCWCCGKQGHRSPKCPQKDKPKSEWAINNTKEMQHAQQIIEGTESDQASDARSTAASSTTATTQASSSERPFWAGGAGFFQLTQGVNGGQVSYLQFEDLRDMLLLDSASSAHVFCNKRMVDKTWETDTSLSLATNGGPFETSTKGRVPQCDDVWLNEKSMTNIFSLALLTDKFRVTFDSAIENAFMVHTPYGILKFKRGPENIYYTKPDAFQGRTVSDDTPKTKKPMKGQYVQTVADNARFYSQRQVARAKAARNLLHATGCPSVADLKNILKMNSIANCPITLDDVDIAEQIYGPDVASLKGKTTRRKPAPVVHDQVTIPKELVEKHKNVILCLDALFVNKIPFLTTISKNIKYRTAHFLKSRTIKSYHKAIDEVCGRYNDAEFQIARIECDREFKPIMDPIKRTMNIQMNYASANEHVPEIERSNRVLKERCRAVFHHLPYKAIPRSMIRALVEESAEKLNYFPPKGGLSAYYSPHTILKRRRITYAKHCQVSFGTYVQAHEDLNPKNTQDPRTLDCIYLRPTDSDQVGHEVLNLATGQPITRHVVTPVPITATIINAVEALAAKEGMKGLRMTTKTGQILWDSAWTAGVDYADETEHDADDENDDQYIELPGVEIDDEEEEQQWEDVDENEIADLLEDATNPVQPEPQYGEEDTEIQQQEAADTPVDDKDEEEQDEDVINRDDAEEPQVRRSERIRNPPTDTFNISSMKGQSYSGIELCQDDRVEYDQDMGIVLAKIICTLNERHINRNCKFGIQNVVTHTLNQAIKKWGNIASDAALKEISQLMERKCFVPIHAHSLTEQERKRTMQSLLFLVEKRDGTIKARHCANGSVQRNWISSENTASPTVYTESVLLSAVIDAEERRDVAVSDVPNAFIQTKVNDRDEDGSRMVMKIRGVLVDILCNMDPSYAEYVVIERGEKVIYTHILRAIYGLLISAILFYKKFRASIEREGFEVNPYDPCVANKLVHGSQLTIMWHVDDVKSSHVNPKVNDSFIAWLQKEYGKLGEVKSSRGKKHDYLGMVLDYTTDGQVRIDMSEYVEKMVTEFPNDALQGPKVSNPASENLFKVDKRSPKLDRDKAEIFHSFVLKGLFLAKRGRPDVLLPIAFLCTRTKDPTESDWNKLVRVMKFLQQTSDDQLTLKADGSHILIWSVDSAFAVHEDFRSHTGGALTMGKGAITSISAKQKVNTRSSTEAEVVAVDDVVGPILWTRYFMEEQGYEIRDNVLLQDNQSAIRLESNGRASAGKRSRHLNIRYFFVTDHVTKGLISIRFCPTDDMDSDYHTKPLQGKKFEKFRRRIMGFD